MKKDVYFGGVPTEPDVKRLRVEFTDGKLKPGTFIPYENVAKAINAEYGTARFISVTQSWRKKLEHESNIIIGAVPGKGFVVLAEPDKLVLSERKLKSAVRSARRSYIVAASIDTTRLTEEEAVRHKHIMNRNANILAYSQTKKQTQLPTMEDAS